MGSGQWAEFWGRVRKYTMQARLSVLVNEKEPWAVISGQWSELWMRAFEKNKETSQPKASPERGSCQPLG